MHERQGSIHLLFFLWRTFESGDPSGLARYALWVDMLNPEDALKRFGRLILPPPTLLEESNISGSDLKGRTGFPVTEHRQALEGRGGEGRGEIDVKVKVWGSIKREKMR